MRISGLIRSPTKRGCCDETGQSEDSDDWRSLGFVMNIYASMTILFLFLIYDIIDRKDHASFDCALLRIMLLYCARLRIMR